MFSDKWFWTVIIALGFVSKLSTFLFLIRGMGSVHHASCNHGDRVAILRGAYFYVFIWVGGKHSWVAKATEV